MKKLLLVILALGFTQAMALSQSSSWEEIFADKNARYYHTYQGGLGQIALENACLTETTVQSRRAVPVCTKWEEVEVRLDEGGVAYEYVCREKQTASLMMHRYFDQSSCSSWQAIPADEGGVTYACTATVFTPTKVPSTIEVRVWEEFAESSTFPGFIKSYTIPNCVLE